MRCALHKEILYLDKEIEDIETLKDVNNKKIKCTKSYYINKKLLSEANLDKSKARSIGPLYYLFVNTKV